ncbi:sensor histidine kinase [Nocardioides scoriae]|uniref:sensor histidine kinase n=1 Tax=Nocardioides scoriae TaxID=642780 RepID=UPI0012F7BF05|nr:HAMP domain-containing sensor histidine kinase [Nocardioides scoriae]
MTSWLPRGGTLPERSWQARHRGLTTIAWLHVPVLLGLALVRPRGGTPELAVGLVLVALLALGGSTPRSSRTLRASAVTLSLLVSTALLIHLFHGMIELHFHFFVVIALVAMYHAWAPYLLGIGFVLAQHAVMGLVMPMAVYNHEAAMAHPVAFAGVHGLFVLAESLACLTYWKATEQALDQEREQRLRAEEVSGALAVANREISDLLAMISHDLRAPLTVINGCAEVALDSWPELDDSSRRTFMGKVQTAGLSLEEMLEETLTLSAIDADGLLPEPTSARLDRLVHDVLGALGHPLEDLELQLDPVVAFADRQQVRHVLTNLVTNAAKYGAPPYAISTRALERHVELVVEDAGPGVPVDFAPRLFDRYARSDEARRGDQRGTGLGLYLVQELSRANDGTTRYEQRAGGGSRFVVSLPMGGPCLTGVVDRHHDEDGSTPSTTTGPSVRWRRTPLREVPAAGSGSTVQLRALPGLG